MEKCLHTLPQRRATVRKFVGWVKDSLIGTTGKNENKTMKNKQWKSNQYQSTDAQTVPKQENPGTSPLPTPSFYCWARSCTAQTISEVSCPSCAPSCPLPTTSPLLGVGVRSRESLGTVQALLSTAGEQCCSSYTPKTRHCTGYDEEN